MSTNTVLLLLMTITLVCQPLIDACPTSCICLPPGSAPYVINCKQRPVTLEMFQSIPTTASQLYLTNSKITYPLQRWMFSRLRNLQYLYIDNLIGDDENENNIEQLENNLFQDLTKLELLSFNGSHLKTIQHDSFHGLTSLRRLFLDNNMLTSIPDGAFKDLGNLRQLMLQHNQLQQIQPNFYQGLKNQIEDLNFTDNKLTSISNVNELKHLERIHLNHNRLSTINKNMFKDLKNLKEVQINNNQLMTIEENTFKTLSNLQILSFINNPFLQCGCDYLALAWNLIDANYRAEIECTKNDQKLSTVGNVQMTSQKLKAVGCEPTSIWSPWGPPEECKNQISIQRRTCNNKFMIPQCNGSHINATACESIYYANYSKAYGLIKFDNFKHNGDLRSAEYLNRLITMEPTGTDFKKKLSEHLKYYLYGQYSFKIREVAIIGQMLVKRDAPSLHVNYQLTMDKTKEIISNVNPIHEDMTILFGDYKADTKPSWSTIWDYDECYLDEPCDQNNARCIIVPSNFNFGCQCKTENYHGDGFHCRYIRPPWSSKKPRSIPPGLVIGLIIGSFVIFISILTVVHWYNKKRNARKRRTEESEKKYAKRKKRKGQASTPYGATGESSSGPSGTTGQNNPRYTFTEF